MLRLILVDSRQVCMRDIGGWSEAELKATVLGVRRKLYYIWAT